MLFAGTKEGGPARENADPRVTIRIRLGASEGACLRPKLRLGSVVLKIRRAARARDSRRPFLAEIRTGVHVARECRRGATRKRSRSHGCNRTTDWNKSVPYSRIPGMLDRLVGHLAALEDAFT